MTSDPESIALLLDRLRCRVMVAGRQTMTPPPATWVLRPRVLPFHDVIRVEKGTGVFTSGVRRVQVRAPAWVLLRAGLKHSIEGSGLRLAVVHLETRLGQQVDALGLFCPVDEVALSLPPLAAEYFQHAIDAWLEKTAAGRVSAHRWMELWFVQSFGRRPAAAMADPRLVKALAWFHAHVDRRVRLEEAPARAGVSTAHLRALFQRHFGASPKKILQEIRLGRAREILESGAGGVAEAAYQSGWEDVSGFARAFRRRFGVPPSEIRRLNALLDGD